jgi:atypical dual specificity phosphatase
VTTATTDHGLWWVIPNELAGMPMPWLHHQRRLAGGGDLQDFDDDLPALYQAGVRSVVSLLNIPGDHAVYLAAGFAFLSVPVDDGQPPTMDQAATAIRFIDEQRAARRPVAVHCQAGIGRTGTMLAAYLIAQGNSATTAVQRVRAVQPSAVESPEQFQFLHRFAERRTPR